MKIFPRVFFVLAVLISSSIFAFGQQAVFNMPNADVLDRGKVYVELDAAFKPNDQEALRKFSSFVPRFVVGVGRNVEIGLNVPGNVTPGADSIVPVPNAKWRFYQNEKQDLALYGGTHFYIPVKNRAYKFGAHSYLAAAKTIGKTRVTAGAFLASKNVLASKAVRGGGQFAVEHAVSDKLTFAADYYTGRHASGYLTPGVVYKPHPQVTTYWSYSIGNQDAARGNHYFLLEIGYNF